MGSHDIAPAHAPSWLLAADSACLSVCFLLWSATYVLMTVRGLRTRSYGMPVLALALNISWEAVYGLYVSEMWLEGTGFVLWLILDIGLVYTTVRFAPREWARQQWPTSAGGNSSSNNNNITMGSRGVAWLLALLVAFSSAGHYLFARWMLQEPTDGPGDKAGKWWRGVEGRDSTEAAFWSAGLCQVLLSVGSLAMLLARGHSAGQAIGSGKPSAALSPALRIPRSDADSFRFTRALGSFFGMEVVHGLLYWYWPEAHGFVLHPLGLLAMGITLVCDLAYPVVLWKVRKTEIVLPDGSIVDGRRPVALEKNKDM